MRTYFRRSSFGFSLESLGINSGFSSCWVLEGRGMYGRSCADALQSKL